MTEIYLKLDDFKWLKVFPNFTSQSIFTQVSSTAMLICALCVMSILLHMYAVFHVNTTKYMCRFNTTEHKCRVNATRYASSCQLYYESVASISLDMYTVSIPLDVIIMSTTLNICVVSTLRDVKIVSTLVLSCTAHSCIANLWSKVRL